MEKLFRPRLRPLLAAAALGLAAVCVPSQARAEEAGMSLHVKLRTGETEQFVLATRPVLTFSDTECIITGPDYEITHLMADIENAWFGMLSGVTEADSATVSVDLSQPGHVIVSGIPAGTQVILYDMDGRRQAAAAADGSGVADVGISGLPGNAVYVVSITNINNFKIYKR